MYSTEATEYQEAYAPEAVYESTEAPGHYQAGTRVSRIAPPSASGPLLTDLPHLCQASGAPLLLLWAPDPGGLGLASRGVPGDPCLC